jgi:hypothetical protein
MANQTTIPAPRVSFIDARTGLISREWYWFFLNLFTLTGGGSNNASLADLQVGPDFSASMAKYDEAIKKMNSIEVLTWLSE